MLGGAPRPATMDEDTIEEVLPLEQLYAQAEALTAAIQAAQSSGADTQEPEGQLYILLRKIEEGEAQVERERMERVQSLGMRLRMELSTRQADRRPIEERWHRAIRAYNAQYEADKQMDLEGRKFGSKAFIPLVRRIVNVVEARLGDLLFPTDGSNFGVESSPVPEINEAAKIAGRMPEDVPVDIGGAEVQAGDIKQAIGQLIDEAKAKAAGMEREISDQLAQSNWPTEARAIIRDGLVLGTGVAKGPTVYLKTKKKWVVNPDGTASYQIVQDTTPQSARVDPWLFFPRIATKTMRDNDSVFEGHPMSATQFAALAEQPGFDKDAIREELRGGPRDEQDSNAQVAKEASGTAGIRNQQFMVWEYSGPVSLDDLQACGCDVGDDPLLVINAVVFFTERGRVLKVVLQKGGTETNYHVWSWQPDSSSIFGYGIPYELGDLQDACNSSWRAAQDNAGLAVGGILVVDPQAVSAPEGDYSIRPNMTLFKNDTAVRMEDVIKIIDIPSRSKEMLEIFNIAKQLCDEVGGPMLAMQGQDAPSYLQTATGMGIAYNSASVWMRRGVKGWDDFITIPMIGQYIDWNMENNPKAEIKGDLRPIAKGSSHLLEAEGQAQRLGMVMDISQKMGIPLRTGVAQLRAMVRSMRLDDRELVPSDDEVAKMEAAKQAEQPQMTPEQERLQLRAMELKDRQADRDFQAEIARDNNELRWAELASKEGLSREQAQAKYRADVEKTSAQLQDRREQRAHDAQALNTEATLRIQTGAGV